MNSAAVARLNLLGKLFHTAGAAAQRLGQFLEEPHPAQVQACFSDMANHFSEAAEVCDALAELSHAQCELGIGHGYSEADSAALATFKLILDGFGACAVFMSSMDFTMAGKEKSAFWTEAGEAMRRAATASWREIHLLIHCFPPEA